MPYKDKEKQREANRERMERVRARVKIRQGNTTEGNTGGVTQAMSRSVVKRLKAQGVTKQGVTDEGVTVPASYVMGLKMYEVLSERPRYLELSDGQVFDRLQPEPNRMDDQWMQACNESSYNFKPHKGG